MNFVTHSPGFSNCGVSFSSRGASGPLSRRFASVVLLLLTTLTAAAAPPARMTLQDVLQAAVAKAKVEDARLELARNTLAFLDTQNRLRIELRPTVTAFAFSNPVLLATNIGTGLLFNRRTAPGFAAMDSARFDALASEVNAETLRVRVQLEAARAYFDVLERQQIAKLAAGMLAARRTNGEAVEKMLQASRITAAEKLSFEQELLDLEMQWLDGESERKTAVARLALLIGAKDAAADIVVEDVEPPASNQTVPALEELVQLALSHRGESQLMRAKVASLRGSRSGPKKGTLDTVNAGYSYVNNHSGVANLANGSILGGNTGLGGVTFSIPLRDVGERAAHERVTAARIRLLELEISAMEDSVRSEVAALRDAASSSVEKERLAARKLDLAKRSAGVARARAETGLATLNASWAADGAVLAAESAFTRAAYERKAAMYALLVACGMEKGDAATDSRVAGGE